MKKKDIANNIALSGMFLPLVGCVIASYFFDIDDNYGGELVAGGAYFASILWAILYREHLEYRVERAALRFLICKKTSHTITRLKLNDGEMLVQCKTCGMSVIGREE